MTWLRSSRIAAATAAGVSLAAYLYLHFMAGMVRADPTCTFETVKRSKVAIRIAATNRSTLPIYAIGRVFPAEEATANDARFKPKLISLDAAKSAELVAIELSPEAPHFRGYGFACSFADPIQRPDDYSYSFPLD